MHQFVISTEPKTARDVATCGEFQAKSSRSCAARKLARLMVENGAVDGPIEARGEDEMLRYTVRSLVAFGKRTIAENPKLRTIKFVDMAGAFVVSDD